MKACLRFVLVCAVCTSLGCSEEVPLRTAVVGKWLNVDGGEDSIEFRRNGSFVVAGQHKRDFIRGRYTFLNDRNIEMRFRFQLGSDWRPRWMPPGVRRSPVIRCYTKFVGDALELRPRGRIQIDNFVQYVEFDRMQFDRVETNTDENAAAAAR